MDSCEIFEVERTPKELKKIDSLMPEDAMQKVNEKAKLKAEVKMMDERLQEYLDRNWMSRRIEEEIKVLEIDSTKLVVGEVVAKGAFGSVHKALYDGQEVAVKTINMEKDDSKEKRLNMLLLLKELSVWKKLDHPNIAKLIGATKDASNIISESEEVSMPKTSYKFVVEYLSGGTLASYLQKNKNLPVNLVIQLALDTAKGLTYLHTEKVVHSDVRTSNMFLDNVGRVKITNFGISRMEALNTCESSSKLDTKLYIPPEVHMGGSYDTKCNVYSFGICLLEMLCSDTKLEKNPSSPNYKVKKPEIPKGCPSKLGDVIRQCLETDPRRRPEMKEVVQMLESITQTSEAEVQMQDTIKQTSHDDSKQRYHFKGCFSFFRSS